MKPFILYYAENPLADNEPLQLEYSHELNLHIIPGTNEPAIRLATSNLETFTKAGHEPTDFNNLSKFRLTEGATVTRTQEVTDQFNTNRILPRLEGETRTYTKHEATDRSSKISRIAKRMSLETLTENREATDAR